MNTLLIHGCYDLKTLKTLESLGKVKLAFDLRARSSNLVPFHHLKELLGHLHTDEVFLSFENDRKETIEGALNILKDAPARMTLIFRDQKTPAFYHELDRSFMWFFHPDGDWENILSLPGLRGIFLPLKWQGEIQKLGKLWEMIEARNLEVFIHADNFTEAMKLDFERGMNLSIDLTGEVEAGFRTVDQEKLKRMKIWRMLNESPLS